MTTKERLLAEAQNAMYEGGGDAADNPAYFAVNFALSQFRKAIESGHLRHHHGCNALREKPVPFTSGPDTGAYKWVNAGLPCDCGFAEKWGEYMEGR